MEIKTDIFVPKYVFTKYIKVLFFVFGSVLILFIGSQQPSIIQPFVFASALCCSIIALLGTRDIIKEIEFGYQSITIHYYLWPEKEIEYRDILDIQANAFIRTRTTKIVLFEMMNKTDLQKKIANTLHEKEIREINLGTKIKKGNIKRFTYTKENTEALTMILLPQDLDIVVQTIKKALSKIDPTWRRGQFDIFSKHFRINLLRSVFTKRISLADINHNILDKDKIFQVVIDVSENLSDYEKASFYGDVLSEYILRFPKERFPNWAEKYKDKPNFIAMWDLHSHIWMDMYW